MAAQTWSPSNEAPQPVTRATLNRPLLGVGCPRTRKTNP
jgi:hypothetical protein